MLKSEIPHSILLCYLFLVPFQILHVEIFSANLHYNLTMTDFFFHPLSEQFLMTLADIAQRTKLSFWFAASHIRLLNTTSCCHIAIIAHQNFLPKLPIDVQ